MTRVKYNQRKALMAFVKASFIGYIRQPSAIVFTILFPVIFIVLFGAREKFNLIVKVFVEDYSADSAYTKILSRNPNIEILPLLPSPLQMKEQLKKTKADVILTIRDRGVFAKDTFPYEISTLTNSLSINNGKFSVLMQYVGDATRYIDSRVYPDNKTSAHILPPKVIEERLFKPIDFVLPGQLGFSLITSGVFGVAFSFFFLRKTQVLKRMFATPIKRGYIVLGEGIARMSFQLIAVLVIIGFGYYFFDFTLARGWETFINMLIVCFLALCIFMGMGFLVSNLSNSEQGIPAISNLISIPQCLLSGTFFSIDFFPKWLQYVAKFLPLTYVNESLREIAFEGKSLWEIKIDILILLCYGALFYLLNVRYFKWQ